MGWLVLRFWESDIKKDLQRCVDLVCEYHGKITEYHLQSADAHHGHPYFFASIVLNDSRSVLLLLKTKFSGGVHHDGRTETTDYRPAPGWGRLWQDSGAAPDFHQHGEVVLPTARPGGEVGSLSL